MIGALLVGGWLVACAGCCAAIAGCSMKSENLTVIAIVGLVAGVALVFTGLAVAAQ